MKKRYLSILVLSAVICSLTLSSCIGSFRLTSNVMKWNNQVGSKFLNELVFFAFWVVPVYEVTSLADILVLNSIEFWSGRNPMTASEKMVDTDHGRYSILCDGKGYTVTHLPSGNSYRLDFIEETQTWTITCGDSTAELMTFIDASHVKMPIGGGDTRVVSLTENDVQAYEADVKGKTFLQAYAL